ncbi:TPA: MBL fold metallo-hydrolase [Candidatus Galligastranaerophilus faecipullorum]|nr:MBL fold metallo-hydrolase [Candidatus Galligastranaerophilus faecipullorum]
MDNKFKIKFRGVRGSYPTPKANFLNFGGNTSCVEVNLGDNLVVLDAGTGIVDLGTELVREHILSSGNPLERKNITATILLSHVHQDHIQGLQFFSPVFLRGSKINVFGLNVNNEDLKDTLRDVLFDRVFPLGIDDVKCSFNIQNLNDSKVVVIKKCDEAKIIDAGEFALLHHDESDAVITFHKTPAHPKNGCLCIKIEYAGKTLVYATDKESYVGSDKRFIEFAHGCDLLIHDAQYTHQDYVSPIAPKQGYGHSTFQMALESAKLAKAKRVLFFHYDPNYDDTTLEMLEREFADPGRGIEFAKEGLEIAL